MRRTIIAETGRGKRLRVLQRQSDIVPDIKIPKLRFAKHVAPGDTLRLLIVWERSPDNNDDGLCEFDEQAFDRSEKHFLRDLTQELRKDCERLDRRAERADQAYRDLVAFLRTTPPDKTRCTQERAGERCALWVGHGDDHAYMVTPFVAQEDEGMLTDTELRAIEGELTGDSPLTQRCVALLSHISHCHRIGDMQKAEMDRLTVELATEKSRHEQDP